MDPTDELLHFVIFYFAFLHNCQKAWDQTKMLWASGYFTTRLSRRAVVSYWRKYVHEVLVNRLGGLSLPRKSVVRLTDRPDMTLDVYRGR